MLRTTGSRLCPSCCLRSIYRSPNGLNISLARSFSRHSTLRRDARPPETGDLGREINKSASSTNPQLQARPDNAFFEDVMAGGPRPPVQIDAVLSNGRGFQLSTGMEVPCAVLVLNGEALLWRPNAKTDKAGIMTMDLSSLGIFDISSQKPDMLIIGTGKRNEFVSRDVRSFLHSLGISVDTMDTRNAASTFNVLAAEGRSVAVALLPV